MEIPPNEYSSSGASIGGGEGLSWRKLFARVRETSDIVVSRGATTDAAAIETTENPPGPIDRFPLRASRARSLRSSRTLRAGAFPYYPPLPGPFSRRSLAPDHLAPPFPVRPHASPPVGRLCLYLFSSECRLRGSAGRYDR